MTCVVYCAGVLFSRLAALGGLILLLCKLGALRHPESGSCSGATFLNTQRVAKRVFVSSCVGGGGVGTCFGLHRFLSLCHGNFFCRGAKNTTIQIYMENCFSVFFAQPTCFANSNLSMCGWGFCYTGSIFLWDVFSGLSYCVFLHCSCRCDSLNAPPSCVRAPVTGEKFTCPADPSLGPLGGSPGGCRVSETRAFISRERTKPRLSQLQLR